MFKKGNWTKVRMHACWEVANNITRFGRFDIDMGPQVCGDPCCVTHILMPVLIRCMLNGAAGLLLWTLCITHLIWSFLFMMKCPRIVDDGWRASCLLQVVQEYERAVIFRLGRLMSGGAKGPGKEVHFHAACIAVWFFTATEGNSIHILWRIWTALLKCVCIYWPVRDRIMKSI